MPSNPPVNFEEKARLPKGKTNADYPYAIKAVDLMKNFVFATLNMDQELYVEQAGANGHLQRTLKTLDIDVCANGQPGKLRVVGEIVG